MSGPKGLRPGRYSRTKPSRPGQRSTAYWRAFERMDGALARNTGPADAAKIARLRAAMFGDVAALERSGMVVIPEAKPHGA